MQPFSILVSDKAIQQVTEQCCVSSSTNVQSWCGGTTPFGFDCSGFVQRVYAAVGVSLPRDAYQQAACRLGRRLPEGAPLLAGDLVFFLGARDPRNRGITHVGMMIDPVRMIHAHGQKGVTIEPLFGDEIRAAYSFKGAWRRN